jgi:hypothetical protein
MSQLSHKQPEHASLFGPIVLIAIGLFFLFSNLDLVDLHWGDVFRLWPLLLVFLGLNILVQQAPRPFGVLLSGLVSLLAVLIFGYILIFGLAGTPLNRLWNVGTGDWQTQAVAFSAQDVETAVLDIEIGPPGAEVYALEDSRNLIEGTISYMDEYLFDSHVAHGQATVKLSPYGGEEWVIEPGNWSDSNLMPPWQLGLNPRIPVSLSLVAAAGSSNIDLRQLILQDLSVNTSAGEVELWLPGGDYDANFQTNAASTMIVLPSNGRHTIDLQVNAGAVTLDLPAGMEARVTVDKALGDLNAQEARLQPVSGTDNQWQTADYAMANNRVDLDIHISLGGVTIR